jgi:hypothetical protein
MEFEDGRIQGFELKFKSLSKDTERYLFALLELQEAGKIQLAPGESLYGARYDQGYEWILDCYFEKRLFDQLEGNFTPQADDLHVFSPFSPTTQKCLDRMLAMGESARVRRIWRAKVGFMKSAYWDLIRSSKNGHAYDPGLGESAKKMERRQSVPVATRIPDTKIRARAMMADYRALLARTGASASELARLDADIAAIEAEKRRVPKGKPDNRPMTEDVFWELIDHGLGEQSIGERLEMLPERLALFKPAAIRKFDEILRRLDNAAYRTDIWALAYLLRGGCSDDSFDGFRGWLILQGRKVFEATLAAPDSFDVTLHHGESGGMDALRDAAPIAYEWREAKSMKPVKVPLRELKGGEMDEEDFARSLPRVAAALSSAAG